MRTDTRPIPESTPPDEKFECINRICPYLA
jgi:hypothetical protein